MSNRKIIICTTFRDFKGNDNDEIQRLFLRSLESQTYSNFELVVTLFGEKEVENELKKFNFKSFFYAGEARGFRYSLTQVILNAIKHVEEGNDDGYIILWTTCDVILDSWFLDRVINNRETGSIGTSHPHLICSSVEEYARGQFRIGRLFNGFDLIYFDKNFLQNKKVSASINKYVYNDWGIFEHFLISLNEFMPDVDMINLFEEAKIYKIENDRQLTDEPNKFLMDSHALNSSTFKRFLKDNGLSHNYFELTYCHFKFKQVKNSFNHYINFRNDIAKFFIGVMKDFIVKLTPDSLKNIIKLFIKK